MKDGSVSIRKNYDSAERPNAMLRVIMNNRNRVQSFVIIALISYIGLKIQPKDQGAKLHYGVLSVWRQEECLSCLLKVSAILI